jgi:predicted PurR-regulated permease PerM
MDRVGDFLREKTPRRIIALGAFVGLLVLFRELLILLVLFVAFERGLAAASSRLAGRLKCKRKYALFGIVALLLGSLGVAVALSAGRMTRAILHARDTFPQRIVAIRESTLYLWVQEHLPGSEKIVEAANHYATNALHVLSKAGHIVAYAIIALVLAVIFILEEDDLAKWKQSLDPRSLIGTLTRWFEHLADAVNVTVQLQLIVAACNTVLTLPVLFFLGIPHKVLLMLLIFVSGLVPVVGNLVSGAVLSLLAYQMRGLLGVGLFLALTFVLHKIEAYYLNPRLTARHVRLPWFLLIASLVAWENLLGFAGLFVSFPVLFVASRIRDEFITEDALPPV